MKKAWGIKRGLGRGGKKEIYFYPGGPSDAWRTKCALRQGGCEKGFSRVVDFYCKETRTEAQESLRGARKSRGGAKSRYKKKGLTTISG